MADPKARSLDAQSLVEKKLPELATLERLIRSLRLRTNVAIDFRVEATVSHGELELPIHSLVIGASDKTLPCLAVVGGVHGLERIGSEVVISWLQTVSELLTWDDGFRERLKHSRLAFLPIANPIGMFLTKRSNGNGVDLMRNAPVDADEQPAFLLGGHRISRRLPWFRGQSDGPQGMEAEARALCEFISREVFPSRCALSVDVHSGFGSVDRLWFPYARTSEPPPQISEVMALKRLFDRSYPNQFYRIEPQTEAYTTHGDLWDWLYDMKRERGVYIPWTLELGSWIWLKKNPRQMFSSLGPFNPQQPHRRQRILRRHLTLFDFLHRAVLNSEPWCEVEDKEILRERAMEMWYDRTR